MSRHLVVVDYQMLSSVTTLVSPKKGRYDYRPQRLSNVGKIHAFKSRGFGGEIGVVTANMKWYGAFLFGAIVLPIVILNFVVAFVFPKFPNDLDLTSQFRFVCGRVGGAWYGRDTLLGG